MIPDQPPTTVETQSNPDPRQVVDAPGASVLARLLPVQRDLVTTLGHAFAAAGHQLYLVGGIVRDLLLDRSVPMRAAEQHAEGEATRSTGGAAARTAGDLDFATDATPEQTRAIAGTLPHTSLYDVGERFGTIGVVFAGLPESVPVEITTFRRETYQPGSRHPVVAYGSSIVDDLARRDVTINAIAADVRTGELHDPFYGQADLAMGLLRAVGDPDERFAEDPLRLLRVARFVSQLGFAVHAATRDAMARQAGLLASISSERVLAEMTRLLCGEYADHGLDVLLDTGLLCVAMPELLPLEGAAHGHPGIHREKDLWEHTLRVVAKSPPRPQVRWAALLHDAAKPLTRSIDANGQTHFFGHERLGADIANRLLRRLNADKATQKAVRRLVELHLRPASYDTATWTDSAVRRLALEAGDVLPDLLDLAAADVTSARADKQRAAARRVQGLRDHFERLEQEVALAQLQSPLDGNALMAMFDRPPGRWIAEVKDHLRELVIDGELAPDDTGTATRIARQLVERAGSP